MIALIMMAPQCPACGSGLGAAPACRCPRRAGRVPRRGWLRNPAGTARPRRPSRPSCSPSRISTRSPPSTPAATLRETKRPSPSATTTGPACRCGSVRCAGRAGRPRGGSPSSVTWPACSAARSCGGRRARCGRAACASPCSAPDRRLDPPAIVSPGCDAKRTSACAPADPARLRFRHLGDDPQAAELGDGHRRHVRRHHRAFADLKFRDYAGHRCVEWHAPRGAPVLARRVPCPESRPEGPQPVARGGDEIARCRSAARRGTPAGRSRASASAP